MQVMIKEQEEQRTKRDKLLKQANDKVKDQQAKQEELKQESTGKGTTKGNGSEVDDSSGDEAAGKEFGRGAHKSKKSKN